MSSLYSPLLLASDFAEGLLKAKRNPQNDQLISRTFSICDGHLGAYLKFPDKILVDNIYLLLTDCMQIPSATLGPHTFITSCKPIYVSSLISYLSRILKDKLIRWHGPLHLVRDRGLWIREEDLIFTVDKVETIFHLLFDWKIVNKLYET